MDGTVIALGGGGFSMSGSGKSVIDDYVLGVHRQEFSAGMSGAGDNPTFIDRFEQAFEGRVSTSVLSLFDRAPWGYSNPSMLLEQDLVYIGVGSTANLLAVWRLHGLLDILRQAAAEATILAGISAGANCWFEASSTDSFGTLAPLDDGLAFLPGSMCPHYLGEPGRRAAYLRWVGEGRLPEGYAVDDFTALRFDGGQLTEAVTERTEHPAYRVHHSGYSAVERSVSVRML